MDADAQFHLELAQATHNSLFPIVMQPVLKLARAAMEVGYLAYDGDEEPSSITWHRRILEAVKAGDAEAACSAMRQHITLSGEDFQVAIRKRNLPQELWETM